MKKRILLVAACALIFLCTIAFALTESASEPEPELDIVGCNLSFRDNVYIKYAVDGTDLSDVKLLIWTAPQTSYEYGTQNAILNSIGIEEVAGRNCVIFQYTSLTAKMMTNNVYARAYTVKSGTPKYSEVKKYSILQYVLNKTGKTGTASTNPKLIKLLEEMLDYGSAAQDYANYKANRPANGNWYQVTVVGGVLDDGCDIGLYMAGDAFTLNAPETNGDGQAFSYWKDELNAVAGTTPVLNLTVSHRNRTYTAVYGETIPEDPSDNWSEGLAYSDNGDGTCTITGIGTCTDTVVRIPETIDGLRVTSIGDYAFCYCASLTSIEMPDSVTIIKDHAFYGCTSLADVYFNGSFEQWYDILVGTFNDPLFSAKLHTADACESSEGLSYENNGDGTCTITGIGNSTDTDVYIPGYIGDLKVTAIGEKAFENQTALTEIHIPGTVCSIGTRAFYGCTGLMEMMIPRSVTSIGTQIFYNANNIHTVYYNSSYFPSSENENQFLNNIGIKKVVFGCNNIGDYSARNLGLTTHIEEIELKNIVTRIGNYAFDNCTSLSSITIPDGVTSIGNRAFYYCTSLSNISIPNSVTNLGNYAFYNCTSLSSVMISDSVVSIGKYVFSRCTSLTSVTIPDSVTSIGDYAFYNCTGLAGVTIGNSVTIVGTRAFENCIIKTVYYTGDIEDWCKISYSKQLSNPCYYGALLYINGELLVNAVIPDSVTSIGDSAFDGCTSLASIEIPDSVTSIGDYAFSGCTSLANIEIPDSVTSIGDAVFSGCTKLASIEIPNGVTRIGKGAFSRCTSLTIFTIPDSVTSIGGGAFNGCTSLASITIPDGVTSIENSTFYDCTNLEIVTIGNGVTSIGYGSFENCTRLEIVTIGNSVTSIGDRAFAECTSLVSIEIPDGVTIIEKSAFCRCTSLTSVTIPNSVTNIGQSVFWYCTSLDSIIYGGTAAQWYSISKESDWDMGTPKYIVHCTDGSIPKS